MSYDKVICKCVVGFSLLFIGNISYAEYNPGKLGEAAGQYLTATKFMRKLKVHECGYLFNKKYDFQSALTDVYSVLTKRDRKEVALFLEDGDMEKVVGSMYHEFLMEYNKVKNKKYISDNKKNHEYICSMFAGVYISKIYWPSEEKWNNAKQKYSK